MVNNQDPCSQIENDETTRTKYPKKSDSEDAEINKTSTVISVIKVINPSYFWLGSSCSDGSSSKNHG